MPFLIRPGHRLYYRLEGQPDRPLLVLGNSLGTDLFMWDPQVAALTEHFRVLRFDVRGHGASDTVPGDATMDELGGDVLDLLDALAVERVAWCGLSLGAMIGQWLAVNAPQRLTRLVLSNASPYLPSQQSWSDRMALARREGMPALLDMVMPRFFSEAYRDRDEAFYHTIRSTFAATDAEGYAACCAAIRDSDFRPRLKDIATPTLVISGTVDAATPHEVHGELLVRSIPGARFAPLPAGHIANVEQPEEFNRVVLEFLTA
jgi:3-oxoadipate enol-lactonase